MIDNQIYYKVLYIDLPTDCGMRIAAVNLIQYLMIAERLTVHTKFDFEFLRTKVHRKVNNVDFINGVMLLTRADIAALVAVYEAYDEDLGEFVPVLPDDVLTSINDRKYINPVNGEILTKDQFSEQVRILFAPSLSLLKSLKSSSI